MVMVVMMMFVRVAVLVPCLGRLALLGLLPLLAAPPAAAASHRHRFVPIDGHDIHVRGRDVALAV